jgi:GNAT superfamily N-acetyltransferase
VGFGVYHLSNQVGFARIITDFSRLAYLFDVFILEAYRGQKLGTGLIEFLLSCPELRSVRKWMLTTRDAHRFYTKFGFVPIEQPERFLQKTSLDSPREVRLIASL